MNGEETEATVFGWYDLGVQFELPNYQVSGPVDAEVLIVGITGQAAVDLGESEETPEGETPEGEGDLVDEVGSEDAPAESE